MFDNKYIYVVSMTLQTLWESWASGGVKKTETACFIALLCAFSAAKKPLHLDADANQYLMQTFFKEARAVNFQIALIAARDFCLPDGLPCL